MKKPLEEDYRYPTTGNATAVDYAEYVSDLELYVNHLEAKYNNDINSVRKRVLEAHDDGHEKGWKGGYDDGYKDAKKKYGF